MQKEDADLVLPLKEWRIRRYLSVRKLAKKAGISTETLFRAERGGAVYDITARRIADALEIETRQITEFAAS